MERTLDLDKSKMIVLGLDGATFDLIEPWAAEGKLPNFRRLMDTQAWGRLESTLPPLTAVAWTTFATGKNAGKHGLFDFVRRQADGYGVSLVRGGDRRAPAFWQILDDLGYRVGVINVPMTYPPDRLRHGFVVSGFDAPGLESAFVHPPELKSRLLGMGYQLYTRQDNLEVWAQSLLDVLHVQRKVFWELLRGDQPDVLVMVLSQLDASQHLFWEDMERGEGPFAAVIPRLYQEMDGFVGEILDAMGPGDALLIVSDHGAGGLKKAVSINQWLLQEGYLSLRQDTSSRRWTRRLLQGGGTWLAGHLPRWAKTIVKERFATVRDGVESYVLSSRIDWARTRAFSVGEYGGIFLNLQGRESQGVVAPSDYEGLRGEIAARLLALRDPTDGDIVIERVHRREEVYHGPWLDQAPDLVLRWNFQYDCRERVGAEQQGVFEDSMSYRSFRRHRKTGVHRLYGVFLASGPQMAAGPVLGAGLADVAPTLLHILGVPVPVDMDGRVLEEALQPAWRTAHPIAQQVMGDEPLQAGDTEAYSASEEAMVRQRLRDLGYLD